MANKVLEMAIAIKGQLDGSLSSSVSQAVSQTKNLTRQISAANKELKQVQKSFAKASGFEKVNLQADIIKREQEINDVIAKRSDLLEKVNAKQEAQSKLQQSAGRLKTAVTGAAIAAAPIALAVKEAMNYESVMADVRKTVDFDTPEGFNQMKQDIIAMSQQLPMSAEGIAKIVAAGGQAGIASKDLKQFAEGAVKMGIAFDISADEAGTMMAQWRTAFGMNQDQVTTLADQINYLSNTTSAGSGPISDIVTRIGPLASTAGLSAGQVAALGASIAGTGTPSEIAATGIKNMMLALTAGSAATKAQAGAFEKLGLNATDMANRMQTDAQGAIIDVLQRIRELPEAEQSATMTKLFGKESVGAIAPLLTQLDGLKDNFNKVGDATQYAGSMEKEYQARSATTENQLQLTKNNITALAVNLGSALLPAVNSILSTVASVAGAFAAWAGEHPTLIAGIVGVTAAIAGLVVTALTINTIVAAVQNVRAAYALMKVTLDAVKVSQLAANAAAMANPYVLIAVAVIALVAALVYLWNTNEGFSSAIIGAWEAIKSGISTAISAVVAFVTAGFNLLVAGIKAYINFWLNLPQNIAFAIGFIFGVISQLPSLIGAAIDASVNFIMNLPTAIATAGSEFLELMSAWLSSAYATAVSMISNLVTGVYNFLLNLPEYCAEAGTAFVAAAEQWASDAYNAVLEWVNQIPSAVSNAISGAWESIKGAFSGGFNVGVSVAGGAEPHANGGVFTRPHLGLVAEAGYPEVIIPINGSQNAMNLWQTAGQMLGVNSTLAPVVSGPTAPSIASPMGGWSGGGDVNVTFAPQITVQGNASQSDIAAALDAKMREFEAMMQRYTSNQRRLSYD